MGCFVSKDKLTKEDMDFLKTHTSYDETTIKEWYKGFKVMKFNRLLLYLWYLPNGHTSGKCSLYL